MYAQTKQIQWTNIRDQVATADSALSATTKKFANVKSSIWKLPEKANAVELRFRGNDSAASGTFYVYMGRQRDDAVFVCYGTIAIGTQTATMAGDGYYGDTLSITAQDWLKTVSDIDATAGGADAKGGMSRLAFDACGYNWILVLFTVVSSGDTLSADVAVF